MKITVTPSQIKAALLFAGDRDVRYYLNGICVETRPTGARLVATDGHRLVVVNVPQIDESGETLALEVSQFIIPRDACETAVKAFGKLPQIEIVRDGKTRTLGGLPFTEIDGKFPEYARLVPAKVSGETAQFNAMYITDCAKARKILDAGEDWDHVGIGHNGNGPAIVPLTDCAFAVVMPIRWDAPMSAPEWFTGKPSPERASCRRDRSNRP